MKSAGRFNSSLFAFALSLAGCGGGSSGAPASTQSTVQHASGTLAIGNAAGATAAFRRRPAFVGAATTHANVWINGALVPSNASSSCTGSGTTGSGTFWHDRVELELERPR
jgi:hypothetical protein